jgi:chromosomal replication initiator protein
MAQVAIEILLEGGKPEFNPVIFHGSSGCGKSHLVQGLVAAWKGRSRHRPAIATTALDFARELNDAIEAQATEEFQRRYRQLALLAIDDLDQLIPKEAAQRELAYTFDALVEAGGRLVATCSSPPEQLSGLIPTLLGRLVSGLSVRLEWPQVETRLEMLRRLGELRGLHLPESAVRLLAEGLPAAVPLLRAALMDLEVRGEADGKPLDEDLVREYLSTREPVGRPTLREIAALTARHFALKVADLRSPSRRRAVVMARDVAMYLARTLSGKNLTQIGTYFDGRDHTTVSHGCMKAEKLVQSDPSIREAVRQLHERLEAASARKGAACLGKTC